MLLAFHHFEYDVSCRFVIYGLYYIEVCSLYAHVLESFYHKWVLNSVKSFFCIYWDDCMVFILQFTEAVYHTWWFADNEISLQPWEKSHLIMVYDLFNVLLDSSAICSSAILAWSFLLFFGGIFVWFWYRGDGGPLSESGRIPSSIIFWTSFRRIIVNFSLNVW